MRTPITNKLRLLPWLGLWLVALVSYFAPWIWREPYSAALAWNAYDLFDLLRFLPEIETGALTVNLQALRLPLIGLAVLLPMLLYQSATRVRVAGGLLGAGLAALTLPPYPQIIDAWRTPGWRVPFWWAIGAIACALVSVSAAPRLGRYRGWAVLVITEVATVPAAVTLARLLPALSRLHAAPVRPGWGFWGCALCLAAIGLRAWFNAIRLGDRTMPEKATEPSTLEHIREVKGKYEAELLEKANVVAVGIGTPMQGGNASGATGIVVSVTHKVAASELRTADLVPRTLEGVRVWVEGVDQLHAAGQVESPQPSPKQLPKLPPSG